MLKSIAVGSPVAAFWKVKRMKAARFVGSGHRRSRFFIAITCEPLAAPSAKTAIAQVSTGRGGIITLHSGAPTATTSH